MIIYFKEFDGVIKPTMVVENKNSIKDVDAKNLPEGAFPCFIGEHSYIELEDSEVSEPIGYYDMDIEDERPVFRHKKTKKVLRPKIKKIKIR